MTVRFPTLEEEAHGWTTKPPPYVARRIAHGQSIQADDSGTHSRPAQGKGRSPAAARSRANTADDLPMVMQPGPDYTPRYSKAEREAWTKARQIESSPSAWARRTRNDRADARRALEAEHRPHPSDVPSPADVEAARTRHGGWSRETLAGWGVAWPPPK